MAGRGRFVDDLARPRMLHAAMLRSPHAHARIVAIETREAEALPGVFAVLTGAEAAVRSGPIRPLIPTPAAVPDYCLAVDRARYVGEPVAAVAAIDRATAEDALERIQVEYEPLPAVVDPRPPSARSAAGLHELGTNVVWHDTLTYGEVDGALAGADGVLRERFTIQRYASTPLETFGASRNTTRARHLRVLDQRPAAGPDHRGGGRALGIWSRRSASLSRHRRRLRQQAPPDIPAVCALLARSARAGP